MNIVRLYFIPTDLWSTDSRYLSLTDCLISGLMQKWCRKADMGRCRTNDYSSSDGLMKWYLAEWHWRYLSVSIQRKMSSRRLFARFGCSLNIWSSNWCVYFNVVLSQFPQASLKYASPLRFWRMVLAHPFQVFVASFKNKTTIYFSLLFFLM